jgi:hypothetical protein
MSLMERRTLSEKQKAASRANGRLSRGAVTPAGREQIRTANLRHGLFSQAREIVLPTLGEDLEEFNRLRQGCYEQWPDAEPAEVEECAGAQWRWKRADERIEELYFEQCLAGNPNEFSDAYMRAATVQACACRDFMRISNRLLKADEERRVRPLTGLPGNILKTKGVEKHGVANSKG